MKAIVCVFLALVVFVSAQGQTANNNVLIDRNILSAYGSYSMIVPSNRTTLTVTLFGFGPNATAAQQVLQEQINAIQSSLNSYSLLNVQMGGIMYYPYYNASFARPASASMGTGSGMGTMGSRTLTGFVATTTFSFSLNASDAGPAIDNLISNGNAYISLNTRPDPTAVDLAQRLAVSHALDSALFKAQAALDRLRLCAINITLIDIESPISQLPSVNIISNNFGVSMNNNLGLNLPQSNTDFLQYTNPDDTGAGRSLVSAFVTLNVMHGSCSLPGAISNLTALVPPAVPISGSALFPSSEMGSPMMGSEMIGTSAMGSSEMGSSELGSSELGSPMAGPSRRRRSVW